MEDVDIAMNIAGEIRKRRVSLGMTQQKLSEFAEISLSTLQKIEAQQVSPSVDTVIKLLKSLHLKLTVQSESPAWEELASLGLPFTVNQIVSIERSEKNLVQKLSLALTSLSDEELKTTREGHAVSATIWALHLHYPKVFRKIKKLPQVSKILSDRSTPGAVIKLYRLCLTSIGKYL